MKTKYLFNCCVLLVLTGSGVLLTEESSIAFVGNDLTRETGKDPHPPAPSPRAGEGEPEHQAKSPAPSLHLGEGWGEGLSMISLESFPRAEFITAQVPPSPSKKVNNQPLETPSLSGTPDNLISPVTFSTNDNVSPLPLIIGSLSGLLHLLEISGLVWAYLKIQQLSEKSRDSRSQIKSLTERLGASEQKQKIQGDQLKTIGSEAASTRNLTSRMNAIEKATQRNNTDIPYVSQINIKKEESTDNSSYLIPKFQGIDVGEPDSRGSHNPYPFLDTYRRSPDNFKNQYAPKIVHEDADNLQKRWSGDHKEIILGEERQGNYWLFNEGRSIYLIPSPKLKVNDMNMRTAGGLFDCNNYTPGYQSMIVVRPAVVSSQKGTNELWKLEQKGILEFS
jgi:hypothetical protein